MENILLNINFIVIDLSIVFCEKDVLFYFSQSVKKIVSK